MARFTSGVVAAPGLSLSMSIPSGAAQNAQTPPTYLVRHFLDNARSTARETVHLARIEDGHSANPLAPEQDGPACDAVPTLDRRRPRPPDRGQLAFLEEMIAAIPSSYLQPRTPESEARCIELTDRLWKLFGKADATGASSVDGRDTFQQHRRPSARC